MDRETVLRKALENLEPFETYKKRIEEYENSLPQSFFEGIQQNLAKIGDNWSVEGIKQHRLSDKLSNYDWYKKKLEKEIKKQVYLKKWWDKYGDNYRIGVFKRYCMHCGTLFYAENYRNTYCREKCVIDASNKRISERKKVARNKVCPICNKQYTATRGDAKFCSAACKQANYRKPVTDTTKGLNVHLNNRNNMAGVFIKA